MKAPAALALACLLGATGTTSAAHRIDQAAGSFSDDFANLSWLEVKKHAVISSDGGVTVSPAEQVWRIPEDAPFSAGSVAPTLELVRSEGGAETLTLWQRVLEPGKELAVASVCIPGGGRPCPADKTVKGVVYGLAYPGGLTGFPGTKDGLASIAGWDTEPGEAGRPECRARTQSGISGLKDRALLAGAIPGPLVAGETYAASFLAGAGHDSTPAPYLGFELTGNDGRSITATEADLGLPFSSSFDGLTSFSIAFRPGAGEYGVAVKGLTGVESHCTVVGPVSVTAQKGSYFSPVLDSLSDSTDWRRIEWELSQGSSFRDQSCSCPTPGSPLAPAAVFFGAGPADRPKCTVVPPLPHPDRGVNPVPASVTGRYFSFCVTLFGRETAAEVADALAPGRGARHYSGLRPVVRSLTVRYFARAALAESRPVTPSALEKWGKLTWTARVPEGSSLGVDVLAEDGSVLVSGAASGADLDGVVDAFRNPAIRLRARLAGSATSRPALMSWGVDWSRPEGLLILNRGSFSPSAGETVLGLAQVGKEGRVRVRVHDSKGILVAELLDRVMVARAAAFSWDGRNTAGRVANPGAYFVSVATPEGAGTRRVEVRG